MTLISTSKPSKSLSYTIYWYSAPIIEEVRPSQNAASPPPDSRFNPIVIVFICSGVPMFKKFIVCEILFSSLPSNELTVSMGVRQLTTKKSSKRSSRFRIAKIIQKSLISALPSTTTALEPPGCIKAWNSRDTIKTVFPEPVEPSINVCRVSISDDITTNRLQIYSIPYINVPTPVFRFRKILLFFIASFNDSF